MHTLSKPWRLRVFASAFSASVMILGITACTSNSPDGGTNDRGAASSSAAQNAQPGTTLAYGIIGNKNDTIYPYRPVTSSSGTMLRYELFDKLTNYSRDGKLQMALATKFTPSNNFQDWDVDLRKGVIFSNGKEMTSKDVVFSFHTMYNGEQTSSVPNLLPMIDPAGVTTVGKYVVHFHLKRPFAPLPELLAYEEVVIISHDSTYNHPIGTGPFTVQSFEPGRQAVLQRNDDYWGPMPGFNTLKITYFKEHDAILNALLSDQIDVTEISGAELRQVKAAGKNVLASDAANYPLIEMRTDIKPFNDLRVRRAFQLMINRQRVVENVYAGAARLGNDYMAGGDSCGDPGIPQRQQNLDKAKQLLKEAGYPHLTVTLTTDGAHAGMMATAQLLAQGAESAGVTLNIRKLSTAAFLDKWGTWPLYINLSDPPYIVGAYDHLSKTGLDNSTHFSNAKFNDLLAKLAETQDTKAQCEIIQKMHRVIHSKGGELIPAIPERITAFDPKVHGLHKDRLGRGSYMFGGVSISL